METSNAILVELKNFLFEDDQDLSSTLKVYQKLNQEALDLLKDMQKYSHLIAFYNIDLVALKALKERLELEGLVFDGLISTKPCAYNDAKLEMLHSLRNKYNISCYIDETENSPWKICTKLHRLKF